MSSALEETFYIIILYGGSPLFSALEEFVPPLPVATRHALYELVLQHFDMARYRSD